MGPDAARSIGSSWMSLADGLCYAARRMNSILIVTGPAARGLHRARQVGVRTKRGPFHGLHREPPGPSLEEVLREAADLLVQQEPPLPDRGELLLDASDPLLIDPAD